MWCGMAIEDQNQTLDVPVIATGLSSGLETAARSLILDFGPINEPRMFGNFCAQRVSACIGVLARCCATYVPPRYSAIIVKRAISDASFYVMLVCKNMLFHLFRN
jgi:hypothetical protein